MTHAHPNRHRWISLVVSATLAAAAPIMAPPPVAAEPTTCPSDEFAGPGLDHAKWDVFHGNPSVSNGELVMQATQSSRVDIQSKGTCVYGVLTTELSSAHLKPQSGKTDSSVGFEHFTGTNGGCHHTVQMVGNGHLGVLRAVPDSAGRCFGDPALQHFATISQWEQLRTAPRLRVYLVWAPATALLLVTDGVRTGTAIYTGPTVPSVPMKVRLNVDFNEAYRFDHIRGAYGTS